MLHVITLQLARTSAYPDGSARHGYELHAPLDETGHIDPESWREKRELCRVRRFWAGEPDRHGWLVHRAGGAGGATWCIDYDDARSEDDEFGYRLDSHRFVAGDYVSIKDSDGDMLPFLIASVKARDERTPPAA